MLDAVANGVAEDVQNDLSNDEEEDTENDVAEWPAILECAHNKDDLADEVDEQEDGVDDVGNDENADWVLGIHTGPVLEREKRDGTADNEHGEGGQAQQPDRQGRAVFVQLEADKAVDEQAGAEGGYEAVLGGGEVRVGGRTRGSDAGIEDERDNSQKEVDVEEGSDLLATCFCVSVRLRNYSSHVHIPTAVNLERTWKIMMTVMTRARMCMKSFATWKMSVFAISMVRA